MAMKFRFPFIRTLSKARAWVTDAQERRELVAEQWQNPPGSAVGSVQIKARPFIEFLSDYKISKLTDYQSYVDAGLGKVWATFRCFDIIAKGMLRTEMYLHNHKSDAKIEDDNHPFLQLMSEPNPFDSWEEIQYVWPFHIGLTGNAYWLKDEMNGKGQPKAIYPLLPQYVNVVPDKMDRVAYYLYEVNGKRIRIERDEMAHFKRPHPNNIIFGLGDMEAAEPLFEDFINRQKLAEHYLSQGGTPSGVLALKEAVEDETEWQKFKDVWRTEYEGNQNAGKTAFLNGEWSYTKLGMTAQELQSIEQTKLSVDHIFALHGVPKSVAGLDKATNYATARQDDLNFRQWTLVPYLDMLTTKLNSAQTLVRSYGPDLRLRYELTGLVNVEQVVKEYKPLVDIGAMTRNELREKCELPEADNDMLDEFLVGAGLQPIDMVGMEPGATQEEADAVVSGQAPQETEVEEPEAVLDDREEDEGNA